MLLLILAAVLPAAYLMWKVYRSDRLEREPPRMLLGLVLLGMISTALAGTAEQLGDRILSYVLDDSSVARNALFFFLVVGPAEEGFKYAVLRWRTWRHPEFDCQYDGVVYAVFVSLGFALWENIGYVTMYGLGAAVARALTAVPGHASFGVFMGACYGLARQEENRGAHEQSVFWRIMSVLLPTVIHGCYDYIAIMRSEENGETFLIFVALVFLSAFALMRRLSRRDRFI